MGQLLDPPSVEGWHTGTAWINTASPMTRIKVAAEQVGDVSLPGVRSIVDRVVARECGSIELGQGLHSLKPG